MEQRAQQIVEMYARESSESTIADRIVAVEESVRRKAAIPAIAIGVVGCLIMGVGMSLTMVTSDFFVLGIIIGIVGLAVICANYPLYKRRLETLRDAARPQIMELSLHL